MKVVVRKTVLGWSCWLEERDQPSSERIWVGRPSGYYTQLDALKAGLFTLRFLNSAQKALQSMARDGITK